MSRERTIYRFIMAGGGTGGHLYPAVAVAQKIREMIPEAEILFIGAKNKIESRVVPQLGFDFKTIWISGFSRQFTLSNIFFPLKLFVSMIQSIMLNVKFKPRVAVGTGAYVAGPVIIGASIMGAKIILLEQNSYPGITNRLLEKRANQIHVMFEDSKKYFRNKSKLMVTGNPTRINLELKDKSKALAVFNCSPAKRTLLILGGSGGALAINEAIAKNIDRLKEAGIQIIWQTGQYYFDKYKHLQDDDVKIYPFISDMSSAFSACDLLIARSGATTIAEVSLLGIPVVFVPSPYVAANHQFKNAESIKDADACILIEDKELDEKLFSTVNNLIFNESRLTELKNKIKNFSRPDAAKVVAENAVKLAEVA
ncbi:undecaprenyldiphospho-muramoylpentapeptide beta-N-acetylglucosaminyltransferase [Bacteroidota bacterium]